MAAGLFVYGVLGDEPGDGLDRATDLDVREEVGAAVDEAGDDPVRLDEVLHDPHGEVVGAGGEDGLGEDLRLLLRRGRRVVAAVDVVADDEVGAELVELHAAHRHVEPEADDVEPGGRAEHGLLPAFRVAEGVLQPLPDGAADALEDGLDSLYVAVGGVLRVAEVEDEAATAGVAEVRRADLGERALPVAARPHVGGGPGRGAGRERFEPRAGLGVVGGEGVEAGHDRAEPRLPRIGEAAAVLCRRPCVGVKPEQEALG